MTDRLATLLSAADFAPAELEDFRIRGGLRNDGNWRCPWRLSETQRCDAPLRANDVLCCAAHEPKRQENHIRRVAARHRERVDELCSKLLEAPVLAEMPKLERARVGDALFASKAPPNFQSFANRWSPQHGSVLLSGSPGTWKTSACIALLHRMLDGARAELESLDLGELKGLETSRETRRGSIVDGIGYREVSVEHETKGPLCALAARAVWTTGLELVHAVRRHPLGQGEPPLMHIAKLAPLLVIDELGPQASTDRDGIIVEVVWARYAKQLPTIATTGMDASEFQEAHGGGLWRRLTEAGTGRFMSPKGSS